MHISVFFLFIIYAVLGSATSAFAPSYVKRGAQQNATLYAYGVNTPQWPIAYGRTDGLYITQTPDDNNNNLLPMSWNLPAITDENWIVNATFVNGTSAGSLFTKPENNYCVGVLPITRISRINGTVSGFALFASQLVYNNNTQLQAQFWAQETDTNGIYALTWNSGGNMQNGSFPVVVKASESS
ncbi:hypothetical protein SI65_00008 [Aspergillus cristatus]|uniref:Uncharacterized protein n=1 Tax=Aspergillus cristatus TaxID=573508 RepID=A0A1E3BN72_ASPCR|nr:hypothetical protein SI65_00008 [Aspergillus cristatus]